MSESKFSGSLLGYFWVNLVFIASIVLTANLLMPFGLCYRERWMAKNTIINGKQLEFNGSGMKLFLKMQFFAFASPFIFAMAAGLFFTRDRVNNTPEWILLMASILFLIAYVLFTVWLLRNMKRWIVKNTTFA